MAAFRVTEAIIVVAGAFVPDENAMIFIDIKTSILMVPIVLGSAREYMNDFA